MTKSLVPKVTERAIQIQQIPAPTFEEQQRARFVLAEFKAEGLSQVEMDDCLLYTSPSPRD